MMEKKLTPTVLIYRMPETKPEGLLLRQYLLTAGITPVTVTGSDTGRTIETLLGLAKTSSQGILPMPKAPVLVLSALTEPMLDDLLEFLRANCPVKLKAVVTPINRRWTFSELALQLETESKGAGSRFSKINN